MVGDRLSVEGDPANLNAHGLQVVGLVQLPHSPGSCQQGFGGDTAAIDAGSAHFGRFDDRRF